MHKVQHTWILDKLHDWAGSLFFWACSNIKLPLWYELSSELCNRLIIYLRKFVFMLWIGTFWSSVSLMHILHDSTLSWTDDSWLSILRPQDWEILMMEALLHIPGSEQEGRTFRITVWLSQCKLQCRPQLQESVAKVLLHPILILSREES